MFRMGQEDNLEIVRRMGHNFVRYKSLRDNFAPHFQTTAIVDNDYFTSHGYDHSVRIMQHLTNILADQFYNWVSEEELFLLASAILLHDIYMTLSPADRNTHSGDADKFLRSEIERFSNGQLGAIVSPWTALEMFVIGKLICAHSDLRLPGGEIVKTLPPIATEENAGETGRIRTGILAALLRYGDELDCTSRRVSDCQALVPQEKRANNPHWRKCELILEVPPPDAAYNTIRIRVDETKLAASSDKENDLELIDELVKKLSSRLSEVNKTVFQPQRVTWWHYNLVELVPFTNAGLTALVEEHQTMRHKTEDMTPLAVPVSLTVEIPHIASVDVSTSKYIVQKATQLKLWRDGHFQIDDRRHSRDWIDTNALLADRDSLGRIVSSFVEILSADSLTSDKVMLVGEGFPGLLLAAQIGFAAGIPSTYVVTEREGRERAEQDKIIEIPMDSSIIIVTDVIAEGRTLSQTLQKLESQQGIGPDRVKKILAVFRRKPHGITDPIPNDILEKVWPLDSSFPMQTCLIGPDKCILAEKGLVTVVHRSDS